MEMSQTYCLCGHPYDPQQFMIQCDVCKDWYHGGCVGVKEYMLYDFDQYHCPRCIGTYGPSSMKIRMNNSRHDFTETDADMKPIQTGTKVFIQELKRRNFPEAENVVHLSRGHQLTMEYLQKNGFENPIIIDSKDGLDMVVPPPTFSLYDIENFIGGDREMDVIDVSKQNNMRMSLRDFVEYYNDPNRTKIFNVISLEFSSTGLSPLVEAPYIARQLDWVSCVWPRDWPEDSELKKPEVQKYCLMGVKDSYTDFHIDFGGTSVWYHVLRGEKVFYLIEPTPANMQLYQQWMSSSSQSETFFGDQADYCYKIVIKQGQTMMIPTGWIHAVLTPVDSLVFGGNFLHNFNIPMQIQVYELEKKMKTPFKFQYPCFETINWFAARRLLAELKQLNSQEQQCPSYLLQGMKSLLTILKQWNADKDYSMVSRSQIPFTISPSKLFKDMSKEIRSAERYLISLNPPKPERESKRKKKKPVNHDFIGYDVADKMSDSFKATIKSEPTMKIPIPPSDRPGLKIILPKNPQTWPFSNEMNVKKPNLGTLGYNLGGDVGRNMDPQVYGNFSMDPNMETCKEHTWKQTSVYDFHDGSNESDYGGFTIDEAPKRKKSSKPNAKKMKKFEDEVMGCMVNEAPKNGIEELLKASAYALGTGGQKLDLINATPMLSFTHTSSLPTDIYQLKTVSSGRASPSTREAIAGMLSISEQLYPTPSESSSIKPRKVRKNVEDEDDDDLLLENMDKVHQDDDFIYPPLDVSDDDEFMFKSKGKREDDEAWNPKARVGPLLPKTNRPAREGAKKTSVEKGLEAAAAKRAKQSASSKRSSSKKKQKELHPPSGTSSSTLEGMVQSNESYSSILTSPNRLKDIKAKLAAPIPTGRKPKKGMKTAKQRLGKILKIHKMMQ